jgi:HlyD family secretion protein
MGRSKRVAVLSMGLLLAWAGLGRIGSPVPRAAERIPRDDGAVWRAEVQPPPESEVLRCQLDQAAAILYAAPAGQSVKKGDLLIELDASALAEKRVQQVFQVRKAETDMILARESLHVAKQDAGGQIELAQKALRLAQGQLKAFTEGEYPRQLALAEGTAMIANMKCLIAEERFTQLKLTMKPGDSSLETASPALREAQLAQDEARLQLEAAKNALAMLKGFGHDNTVAELELAVTQREFDLAHAKGALSAATAKTEAILRLAEISCRMEQDRLARLDDQIARAKIYAPRDGTVIYPNEPDEPPIRPGALVHPGQIVLHLLPAAQTQ